MRHSTKTFGNTSRLFRILRLSKQIFTHHCGSQSLFEIFNFVHWCIPNNFAQPISLNFAIIQFYQRCDVVHVSNYIVCSQVAICLLTALTCVWLRFYLTQKGPLLWMPISYSILNQIGQFQEPWLCPQIVGNFSLGWGYSQNKGPRLSWYSSQ
jgi:hypothetical protein